MGEASCHACGGPIEIGEEVAVYHKGCDKYHDEDAGLVEERRQFNARIKALGAENAALRAERDMLADIHLVKVEDDLFHAHHRAQAAEARLAPATEPKS